MQMIHGHRKECTIWPLECNSSSSHEQQIHFVLLLLDSLASLIHTLETGRVAMHEADLTFGVDLAKFLDDFGCLLLIAADKIDSR